MRKIIQILFIFLIITSCSSIKIDESQKRFILNDTGNDKFYLVNFINKNNHQLGKVPTLMIHKKDSEEIIRSDKEFNGKLNLKRNDFIRIEILTVEKSIALYGSAGKDGVLIISYYGKPNL